MKTKKIKAESIEPIKLVDRKDEHRNEVIRLTSDDLYPKHEPSNIKNSSIDRRPDEKKLEQIKSDKPETILFESNVLVDKLENENERDLGRGFGSKNLSIEVKKRNFKSIEEQWTQENHATLNTWVTKFAVVIVILLLGGAIWAFSTGDKGKDVNENLAGISLLTSIDEEKAQQEQDKDNRKKAVEGFLQASTIEERLEWCRDPEDTRVKMRNYYDNKSFKSFKVNEILKTKDLIDKGLVVVLAGLDEEVTNGIEEASLLLTKRTDGSYRVDWAAFVVYQPFDMKSFVSSMSTKPHTFRLEVTSRIDTGPYLYSFSNDTEYQAYRVSIKGDEESYLYAYSRVGSKEESKMREMFESALKKKQRVILTLAYPEGSETERCVEIIRVDSDLWYLP